MRDASYPLDHTGPRCAASWSFDASWRFGASWSFAALALRGASTPWRFAALWRFLTLWQHSGDEHRRRRLRLRACGFAASAIHGGGNAAAMNAGGGAWVAELAARRLCGFAACAFHGSFAALRLCGLRVPWQLCGFAACAFHGGFAALRLEGSMAALRLWRFSGCARVPEPACNVILLHHDQTYGPSCALRGLGDLRVTNPMCLCFPCQGLRYIKVSKAEKQNPWQLRFRILTFPRTWPVGDS